MSNLVRFPDPRLSKDEASLWLVRLEEGLSEEERAELEQWLESDPAHVHLLVRMARAWDALDPLKELAKLFPLDRHGEERRGNRRMFGTAVAALALFGVIGLGIYVAVRSDAGTAVNPVSGLQTAGSQGGPATAPADPGSIARDYRTAVGEQLSARLSDGSVITLNTDTLLRVEYAADERRVTLEQGEAIFRVASDPARPFRVHARERIVQAVGTVFNVRLKSQDAIEVLVTEGRVRVGYPVPAIRGSLPSRSTDLTLAAGDLAVLRSIDERVSAIQPEDIEANLAWQHGMLIYRGETLEAVLADMSRYTTVTFTIADESLRDRQVGGYFRAGDVDGLLLALHESFGIEQRRDGDTVLLTRGR